MRRRTFLSTVGAGLATAPITLAKDNPPKRLAIITTEWRYHCHAWHMGTRFLVGYPRQGSWHQPPIQVVSAYVDQFPENDLARQRSREFGFPIYDTIAQALRCGGEHLAVDAVLIIGEHGDYPVSMLGQEMLPRRYFFELADVAAQLRKRRKKAVISPLAVEAVRRIDAIFDIERAINGKSAQDRLALRQEHSAPLVADLEEWMRDSRSKLSKNSDVAEAMDYMLKAWPAFAAFLDDEAFAAADSQPVAADQADVAGFAAYLTHYEAGLDVHRRAIEVL